MRHLAARVRRQSHLARGRNVKFGKIGKIVAAFHATYKTFVLFFIFNMYFFKLNDDIDNYSDV